MAQPESQASEEDRVGVGAVLALWAVACVAIADGRTLLKVPLTWITRTAAVIMVVLAGISLVEAFA